MSINLQSPAAQDFLKSAIELLKSFLEPPADAAPPDDIAAPDIDVGDWVKLGEDRMHIPKSEGDWFEVLGYTTGGSLKLQPHSRRYQCGPWYYTPSLVAAVSDHRPHGIELGDAVKLGVDRKGIPQSEGNWFKVIRVDRGTLLLRSPSASAGCYLGGWAYPSAEVVSIQKA